MRDVCIDDIEAWQANPSYRWVYNKLDLALQTGLLAAPYGVEPTVPKVIWRPITNLHGLGMGTRLDNGSPGYFWSEYLTGNHISIDCMVEGGYIKWHSQSIGVSDGPEQFTHWESEIHDRIALAAVRSFVYACMSGYEGPLNVETIGGRIIEVHLRLSPDWVKAGLYDDYPAPAKKAYAYPIFKESTSRQLILDESDSPRVGIMIASQKLC